MKKARTIQSGREVWSDVIEASEVSTTPTADGIPRAVGGKIAAGWIPVGSGGDVLVRDVSSIVEVNPVSAIIFPDGSITNLGTGQVQVELGGGGGTAVQRLVSSFVGNGSQTVFSLPANGLSSYGVDVYIRTAAGVYKRLMSDEYSENIGYSDDITDGHIYTASAGTPALYFDGDVGTGYSGYGIVSFWVQCSFGEQRVVRKARIYGVSFGFGSGRITACTIAGSNDLTTWETWAFSMGLGWNDLLIPANIGYAYWRLTATNSSRDGNGGWMEIELCEAASGISGVTLAVAPGSGDRIEVVYYVAS